MTLINDPDDLTQGASSTPSSVTFETPAARVLVMSSSNGTLPQLADGEYFLLRSAPDTQNNGLWLATGSIAPDRYVITGTKISGPDPIAGGPDTFTALGATTASLNIAYDVATREVYLVEQNGLSADGVLGQTVYSKMMIDWKDDDFLVANAPFPMLMIDADAGKAIVGQDASGNNNGWVWADVTTPAIIRTRKLVRNMGWTELDSNGAVLAVWPCIVTLGDFEDPDNDIAYYQFGNDTTINDTVDFDFAGPVNETIQAFERLDDDSINGGTGVAISADGRNLTRSDSGDWQTDGFKVGGRILLRDCENTSSNGDASKVFGAGAFLITSASADILVVGTPESSGSNLGFDFVDGGAGYDLIQRNDGGSWLHDGYQVNGTVTIANGHGGSNDQTAVVQAVNALTMSVGTGLLSGTLDDQLATFGPLLDTGSPDTTMNAAVDNRNVLALRLRIRDADPFGKTYGQANLASAGKENLGGLAFSFPLANTTDLKISATDATITGSSPYTGMTLTIYDTPQLLGGPGANALVGGPYYFGFVVDCNDGTDVQVFEWIQYQLRQATDIDNDANVAIGRTIDGLARFLGDSLEAGSVDGGLTFPRNPQGGGSGLFLFDLNSASRNSTSVFDNDGTTRGFPIGTTVTLDFNQTLIDDTVAAYTLYFDRTIRNTVGDLVITAGTGPIGTFDSAGTNLPASLDSGVGAYVRIAGLTGADAAMNGVYQVTSIATGQYDVVRYDGNDIVTTTVASLSLDEHPIDSPDAIIVQDNVPANVTGLASSDYVFTFDYSNNTQGGRTGGTDAYVVARAVGQQTAQYTQSTVQQIQSGIALTIPVSSQIERNFLNP